MLPKAITQSLVMIAVCALAAGAQEHTKDSLDTVKKAVAEKKAVLIDVREKSEWDSGHLKDARLLPLSRLTEGAGAPDLPRDKPIYLHCAAGRRCLKAAEILRAKGYDARPLKLGYKDLVKEGFPRAGD